MDQPVQSSIVTPPELSDKYAFECELGRGSQGVVYKAIRKYDKVKVAIKRIRIDSVENWKAYNLFEVEAEKIKEISLPSVARVYDAMEFFDIPSPCVYVVQEYIEGSTLEKMVKSGYRFTINKVFKIASKLLETLKKLHHAKTPVLHRDLKPGNIIMRKGRFGEFEPVLVDFGVIANPQVHTGGSTVAGTYGYMPPEQLMGHPSEGSDIYALAATIVFLLTGVEPTNMQVNDFRLIIEPHMEDIPNVIVATLRQMLDPKVDTRLIDIDEISRRFSLICEDRFDDPTLYGVAKTNELENLPEEVKELGQHGNINIWCALPDLTPREYPEIYKKVECANLIVEESIIPKIRRWYNKSIGTLKYSLLIYIIIWLALCVAVMSYKFTFTDFSIVIKNITININIIFAIIITVIMICIVCVKLIRSGLFDYVGEQKNNMPLPVDTPNVKKLYQDLLTNGSKSVATIVEIEYQPLEEDLLETYYQIANTRNHKTGAIERSNRVYLAGYYHSVPLFRVKYKFNPPDDNNPLDLIHTIYLTIDPSKTLKVGDPLPILYLIDKSNNLLVSSMPYPFPLDDIVRLKFMIHRTVLQ